MDTLKIPRWARQLPLLLALLSLLSVLPLPAAAQPETPPGTPAPAASTPEPVFVPLERPSIDARPLLDAIRSGRAVAGEALASADLGQAATINTNTAENRSGPASGDLSGLVVEPVEPAPAAPAEADGLMPPARNAAEPQQSSSCYQALSNPQVTNGTGWPQYRQVVYYTGATYYSAPHSLRMYEDNDGYPHPDGNDSDVFYQAFNVPGNATNITVQFQIGYSANSVTNPATDYVYFELFQVNSNGSLGSYITDSTRFPYTYYDNQWHPISWTYNTSTLDMSLVRGKRIALVIGMRGDGYTPQLNVYHDDITATICQPVSGTISGTVRQSNKPSGQASYLTSAKIALVYFPASTPQQPLVLALDLPDAGGNYRFTNVPALPAGGTFQVFYINDNYDTRRLWYWGGPLIKTYSSGQQLGNIDFDLTNLALQSPPHNTVAASGQTVTFTWAKRAVASERYLWCLYDVQTPVLSICTTRPVPTTTSFSITAEFLATNAPKAFNFRYGRQYAWFVAPVGPSFSQLSGDPNELRIPELGSSYFARGLTFLANAPTPPGTPPNPGGSPPAGSGQKDWTVMVYIAGDNDLGDFKRYPNPNDNLRGQFEALRSLAGRYPNINLVVLTDFFDKSLGTQICHLKPGSTNCQQLGEKNTADPNLLGDFVKSSLDRFPANHTMLIISGHGHGIAGVALDETSGLDAQMKPEQIRAAFDRAGLAGRKLDVLFYNACLMGNFETLYEASAYAKYLVASSNEIWIVNLYSRLLPLLSNAATKNNPRAVAVGAVDAYYATITTRLQGYAISIAAYDLAKVGTVNAAISGLGNALINNAATKAGRDEYVGIRNLVQLYDSSGDRLIGRNEDAFVDLLHLAILLRDRSANAALRSAASNLVDAIGPLGSGLQLARRQVSGSNGVGGRNDLRNATGLAVFLPNGSDAGAQDTLMNLYLNTDAFRAYRDGTSWDEYLREIYEGVLKDGKGRVSPGIRTVGGSVPTRVFMALIRR